MAYKTDLLISSIAPAIWGSSYIITTELLPDGYPMTVAMLRALPAGILLLLMVRQLPPSLVWWGKVFILGALNFSLFWWLLFEAAYRLPGGVAATIGAIQPLFVIFLSKILMGRSINIFVFIAAILGFVGVGCLILTSEARFDMIGIMAGALGAFSMATGVVLSRKWHPPVSALTFTAWQMTAGGLLLVPVALIWEPPLPDLTSGNILGLIYLGLIGGAFTYIIWFRGISKLEPANLSILGFLSPTTAVILGWWILDQDLNIFQLLGVAMVMGSVWLSQRALEIKPQIMSSSKNTVKG